MVTAMMAAFAYPLGLFQSAVRAIRYGAKSVGIAIDVAIRVSIRCACN